MKRILLSLVIGIGLTPFTFAQTVTIPDVNFKAYLVANTNINTNADPEIQVTEAIAFNGEINCNSNGILDLTGLEAFVNLTVLNLWYEPFTTIDLSQNVNLVELVCFDNEISSLDVSNCVLLKTLRCERNAITTIDVSMLSALEWLLVTDCQLTSLDVSSNPDLTTLDVSRTIPPFNSTISVLDVTNNPNLTYLNCSYNVITSLDVSGLTNLDRLYFSSNQISSIDISNSLSLTAFGSSDNPLAGDLDFSNHASFENLYCSNNLISSLNLKNGNNTNFTGMFAHTNPNLTCIEVDDVTWADANWNAWNSKDSTAYYSINCSGVSSLESLSDNSKLNVYPNPSRSMIHIESSQAIESVSIFNTSGMLVLEETNATFSIESLNNGMYLLEVSTAVGTQVQKIIKE